MIWWSGTNKKNSTKDRLVLLQKQMEQWNERYRRLEQALDRLQSQSPQVTIEHVHIHQPVLEKLEFRMDGLEIEQLSGSLNLGNNFGAKMDKSDSPKTTAAYRPAASKFSAAQSVGISQPPASAHTSAPASVPVPAPAAVNLPGFEGTPTGFRFTPRR